MPARFDEAKEEALASFRRASQFKTTALKTIPGAPKSTLPVIARPDIGQAETGIGGLPVQGQFFPPIRAQTMPVNLESKRQFSELAKRKGAKPIISSPVMAQDHERRVLAKIPTVDLDTAIYNEKQRVAAGRIFAPSIRLASRMDLKPPPIPPKASNRTSQATKMAGLNGTILKGILVKESPMASTSSAMLSPASEELRRRSPRQLSPMASGTKTVSPRTPRYGAQSRQLASPQLSMALDSKPLPKNPPYSVVNFSMPVDVRKSALPLNRETHQIDIRPSRQVVNFSSPRLNVFPSTGTSSPVSKPTKIGLPTHPRASRAKTPEKHKHQSSVERDVDSLENAKSNKLMARPLPRDVSVVHRPRPIPRWPEIDRAIFPAEGSPNMHEHKRSLSNGTSRNKKCMVFPDAANRLHPLPPPPKSARTMAAGDTRSMTWDEKMDMFYPGTGSPRSSTAGSLRRRSRSVPDIPLLSMLLDEKVGSVSPRSFAQQTEGSVRTSVATQSISNLLEDFPRPQEKQTIGGSWRANSTTYQGTRRETELEPKTLKRTSRNVADRRSSPVLPAEDLSLLTPCSEAKSQDDDSSGNWGSIHSPVAFVNVQKARAVEVPQVSNEQQSEKEAEVAAGAASPLVKDGMEASAAVHEGPDRGIETGLETMPAVEGRQGTPEQGWHRRVGEECPTFSERRQATRPRKVPPPAPLLLRRTNLVPMAIQAQPSPLESPDHALAVIQEQLKRLDEPDSEAGDRMTLLANLETELGQQEDQWKGLRGTLMVRDSQSTMSVRTVTPNPDSVQQNRRLSLATPRDEDALPANQEGPSHPLQGNHGPAHSPSSQASYPTKGGIVQQGLAQDEAGYVGTRTVVPTETEEGDNLHSSSPESSHLLKVEDADSLEREYDDHARVLHANPAKTLWCPTSSPAAAAPGAGQTFLWTPAAKVAKVAALGDGDQICSAVAQRRIRKHLEPLSIESSRLWEKPLAKGRFSYIGLWRSSLHSASSKGESKTGMAKEQLPSRPLSTRKPPRRKRRVTLLPDIVESPKPIPDKRGTLGIFQFPWGEMSDMASLPERRSRMIAMPDLMASVQDGVEDNSTSFFDDYEAEEDGDSDYGSFSDSEEEGDDDDDDDGFDETVLWEIASLLTPSQERRRQGNGVFPTEKATHQRGEDSGSSGGIPSGQTMELVRRDNSEALRLITTNFASSETGQIAAHANQASAVTARPEAANAGNAPTRELETPDGDGPHATATPTTTRSTDVDNLYSATDAARGLSPKAELPNGRSDSDEFISNRHMPGKSVPRRMPGAPMRTGASAHETGVPHVAADPTIPVPGVSSAGFGANAPQTPQTWWTLNSVRTEAPLPLPAASRALLPSADTSVDEPASANEGDFVFIQTLHSIPYLVSAPPDLFNPSSEHSTTQLSPQTAALQHTQHKTLPRSAYQSSSFVGSMAMLWSPQPAPILRPSKGLSQPDTEIWNSYLPVDTASRAVPRKTELVALESTSLWTSAPAKKAEKPSRTGLWSTGKSSKSDQSKAAAPPSMWTKPAVVKAVSYGLAQPDVELWATYLPGMDETPRVKQREAQPAVIESQSLWTKPAPAPVVKNNGPLWNSPKVSPQSVSFGLWQPCPVDATEFDEEPVGLFSLDHRRSDFRTSSLSPAALNMERRRRAPLEPYPDFVFAHLWSQAPLWDAAANLAKVKEREEIDALVLEGLFSLKHRRTTYRTTTEPPAALGTKTKPRISQHTLPKLTSDSLWSVQSQPPAPIERDWLALSTGRMSRASSVTSTANSEADSVKTTSTVASSTTADAADKKRARRVDASPAKWLEALHEAMAAGQGDLSKGQGQDQVLDSPESPSSAYQLWSKRDDAADSADEEPSMWKPSSSPTNNFLVLTATPGQLDDAQLRASDTLRRISKTTAARPPPPVFHGASHSAFLPAAGETPRDFSAQGLWSANADALSALEDERAWLDQSLRGGLALVQLG